MPIYEYQCEQCHCTFERKQRYDEEPVTQCECGGKTRRLIQPAPIIFKGSGFYVNDYKKASSTVSSPEEGEKAKTEKPDKAVAAEAKSGASASASSAATAAPAKPAAATETKSKSSDTKANN